MQGITDEGSMVTTLLHHYLIVEITKYSCKSSSLITVPVHDNEISYWGKCILKIRLCHLKINN